jgi:diadenosine tetraphosphate (Ap4A) HIT family hydrolase
LGIENEYPVSERHTLVVPREHQTHLFELPGQTQDALWPLVAEVRAELQLHRVWLPARPR